MRRIIVLLAALLLVLATAAPAAAKPAPVTIVSHMDQLYFPSAPNGGGFIASGSDLVCASGTVLDLSYAFTGYENGRWMQIGVRKAFTCHDNTGTFYVALQIRTAADGTESFTWVAQGGTEAYRGLRGSGHGTTAPADSGVVNTYTGYFYTAFFGR